MTEFVSRESARKVLASLAEEFLVDIPASHDGKGGYFIEYNVLANALVNAKDEWLDQVVGYANTHDFGSVEESTPTIY